jgi:hypothetical protein
VKDSEKPKYNKAACRRKHNLAITIEEYSAAGC